VLKATFPKNAEPGRLVSLEWEDDFRATMRLGNHFDRLPHDLEHYVIDAELGRPWAFWPMLAQKAPYVSVTPVDGKWPRERVKWFDEVKRKHKVDLDESENAGATFVMIARGDLSIEDWAGVRNSLQRAYTQRPKSPVEGLTPDEVKRIVAAYIRMERRWKQVPFGGELTVHWPARPPSRGPYAVRPAKKKVGKLRIR
jgi:hypothetical protein